MAVKSVVRIEASVELAMSLLIYIYTGELTLTTSKPELEIFAKQLELPALEKLCECLVTSVESSNNMFEADEVVCGAKEEVAESKLDLKQIWGESDSDSEEEGNRQERESDVGGNTEVEEEDYHAIMCTQRRLHSANKPDDEKEGNRRENFVKTVTDDLCIHDRNVGDIEVFTDRDRDGNAEDKVNKVPEDIDKRDDDGARERSNVCKEKKVNLEDANEYIADDGQEVDSEGICRDIDMHEDPVDDINNSVVVSSDDEIAPSPKRARLSTIQEMEIDSAEDSSAYKDVAHKSRTSVGSLSASSLNQSGADLFGSPTPVKSNVSIESEADLTCLKETTETSSQEESKSGNKGVKRKLTVLSPIPGNTMDNSIILTDSDSDTSENGERKTENISAPILSDRNMGMDVMQEVDKQETASKDVCDNSMDLSDSSKAGFDEAESRSASMYDDDLEITGDNFEEMTKGSPVFKDKKSSKSKAKNIPSDHNRDIEKIDNLEICDDVYQGFEDSFNDEMVKGNTLDIDKSVHDDDESSLSIEIEENKDNDRMVVEIESEESLPGLNEDADVDSLKDKVDVSNTTVSSDSSPMKSDNDTQQSDDAYAECVLVDDQGIEEPENGEDNVRNMTGSSGAGNKSEKKNVRAINAYQKCKVQ